MTEAVIACNIPESNDVNVVGRSRTVSVGEKPLGWARCRSASSHAPTPATGTSPCVPPSARTRVDVVLEITHVM